MVKSVISNPVLDKLPKHLHQYIHPQNYGNYTPANQATWRYVMAKNIAFLSKVAHDSYLEGLKKTGISLEQIPSMYGMNRILQDIGWAAVAVDGFIPPAAFMEFQAYNVLVIASDIRSIAQIEYTPAPDIIHESAGHAPIIANPEYAEYLRRFGEIGSKAISSAHDLEMYEAIRLLSVLKEQPNQDKAAILKAEKNIAVLQNKPIDPSEMAQIRNLHWWTVEYGLIGTLEQPKIYGAGLLSSIGESKNCLKDAVKKIPYTIAAADQSFDITKPQPQLFVTPDFAHLSLVLEQFANTMALRSGGLKGVQKLVNSKQLGTIELSTGLQISGLFTKVIDNQNGKVAFFQTTGKTALAYHEKELIGHGTTAHQSGFGSPLGKLKGINIAIEDMSPRDLDAYNIYEGKRVKLAFEGDIVLEGEVITGTRNLKGKIILIAFKNCLVTYKEEVLFEPSWGIYHLAVGKKVVAAYAGPADNNSFDLTQHELSSKDSTQVTGLKEIQLNKLFAEIANCRSSGAALPEHILTQVENSFTNEWLLILNLLEVATAQNKQATIDKCQELLAEFNEKNPDLAHLTEMPLIA